MIMKRNILKLATAALMCAAVAGCCKDATDEPDYGAGRAEAVLAEAAETNIMQIPNGMETALTLTVELNKPVDRDVRFNLFPASDLVDNYNFQQAAEYNSLPANYFQLGTNIDFPQGTTTGSTTLVLPDGLPDDGEPYALGIRLSAAYVDYTSINTEKNSILYIFYREGEEAPDPNLPPVVSLTGSNEPTLVDGENPVTVSFTVSLSKSFSEEVTVDLAIDSSAENSLTEQYLTWSEHSVTFAPYELSKTVNVTVNSLPDYDAEANDYEKGPDQTLRIVLKSATPAEIGLSTANNAAEYTFTYPVPKRPTPPPTPAVQKAAIFSNFSTSLAAAATVNVNKTLTQWTLEYWVKHDDNSSNYGAPYAGQWTSSAAGPTEWRKRVFPPESIPVGNVPGIAFRFWPQGGQNIGPMMQFTSNSIYSLSTGNGGFEWKPDEWVHLAITYDGENMRYYINGVPYQFGDNAQNSQQNVLDFTQSYPNATGWTSITIATPSSNTTYSRYYKIELAQLRLWSVERSAEEIKETMGMSVDASTDGLEAYWKMDEGSGAALKATTEGTATINASSSRISWSSTEYNFTNEGKNN